ncbi:hypothetical protein [Streptomyces griseorubiginosus]|uniref:hypothetical protein n=1 Tax=Streptomyces griseorubiginosus TaxID=67304 RepID=UPI002E8151F4|nr:hypothetical protein [Streptomyces griseorubiginosus]WUB49243.1 hypothetical protein OHN19_40240 [Streptomyces griseorubiginosus]WUB57772.1 hypothetical protein OG942_40250 [Streptomyces griseorubiginosus]
MTSKAARRRFKKAERLRALREARRESPWKRRGERFRTALGVVVAFAFGAVLTGYAGLMLAGALGLSGTPGELHVDSCGVVRPYNNKPVTECHGQLLSTTGRLTDPDAMIQADARIGSTIAVRDQPYVGLETLGPRAIVGWATLMLTGLLVLAVGVVMTLAASGRDASSTIHTRAVLRLSAATAAGGLLYGLTVLYEHLF